MSTDSAAASAADKTKETSAPASSAGRTISIYHLYSMPHRKVILGATAMLALLTPFSDTVYLPALALVGEDLKASDSMVALTVSIYLACVGVGQLLWGTLSDKFGRHKVLMFALVAFFGFTVGCIFSTSISMFLALRSLQVIIAVYI